MNDYYPRGLTMSQLRADEERLVMAALYREVMNDGFPGLAWDDLDEVEQRMVEREVRRRQRHA